MLNQRPMPPAPGVARVGEYRLLAKIGEGGMGVVHLAQGPDGNRVALKVLRPHIIGDDEARERLAREVASLRRVRSPRIAEVIDADPWGATPFVATRYVPGLSLHEHARQEGPISGEDLRHFATGLAEAVIAVHQVGVLHRDIKPSNVLLEGRSPVLIDFGLARLAEDPRADAHRLAARHARLPRARDPLRRRRDDGLRRALVGGDRRVRGDRQAAVRHRSRDGDHGPGPARRARPVRGARPRCFPWCARCLAPDPADRPETAAVLASLRSAAPSRRRPVRDDPTLPFALADPPSPPRASRPRRTRLETGAAAGPRAVHAATGTAADRTRAPRRPADGGGRPRLPRSSGGSC